MAKETKDTKASAFETVVAYKDAKVTFHASLSGDVSVDVACRNLNLSRLTPQQFVELDYLGINEAAKKYDNPPNTAPPDPLTPGVKCQPPIHRYPFGVANGCVCGEIKGSAIKPPPDPRR